MTSDWDVVHPKQIFAERRERARDEDVHLTPSQTHGVLPQAEYMTVTGNRVVLNLTGQENMKHVEADDFIIHLRSFQGGIEHSTLPGKVSNAYTVLTPKTDIEPRFYRWVLKSSGYIQELNASTNQLRDGQSIKFADFAAIFLPVPPLEEQRRIADFLDDHVARIDEAVGVRSKQLGLLEELRWAEFERELGALEKSRAPLGRFLKLVADGPFGSAFSSDDYVDDGPAVIRLGDIGPDEFRGVDLARIPYRIYDQFPRCRIRPGELLVASLGEGKNHAGRACVVPEDIGPAMVKGKCFRVVVDESLAVPRFLAMLLSSPMAAKIFELQSRGSTMQMINIGLLRETRFPMPDMVGQERLMRDQVRRAQQLDAASEQVAQSIQLLEERKRSLITAAVTGELDVTTAKPIGMGKWVPNVGASVEAPAAAQARSIGGIG